MEASSNFSTTTLVNGKPASHHGLSRKPPPPEKAPRRKVVIDGEQSGELGQRLSVLANYANDSRHRWYVTVAKAGYNPAAFVGMNKHVFDTAFYWLMRLAKFSKCRTAGTFIDLVENSEANMYESHVVNGNIVESLVSPVAEFLSTRQGGIYSFLVSVLMGNLGFPERDTLRLTNVIAVLVAKKYMPFKVLETPLLADLVHKPFSMYPHLYVMEAIMDWSCDWMLTVDEVVSHLTDLSVYKPESKRPTCLDEALLLWVCRIYQLMSVRLAAEETELPLPSQPKLLNKPKGLEEIIAMHYVLVALVEFYFPHRMDCYFPASAEKATRKCDPWSCWRTGMTEKYHPWHLLIAIHILRDQGGDWPYILPNIEGNKTRDYNKCMKAFSNIANIKVLLTLIFCSGNGLDPWRRLRPPRQSKDEDSPAIENEASLLEPSAVTNEAQEMPTLDTQKASSEDPNVIEAVAETTDMKAAQVESHKPKLGKTQEVSTSLERSLSDTKVNEAKQGDEHNSKLATVDPKSIDDASSHVFKSPLQDPTPGEKRLKAKVSVETVNGKESVDGRELGGEASFCVEDDVDPAPECDGGIALKKITVLHQMEEQIEKSSVPPRCLPEYRGSVSAAFPRISPGPNWQQPDVVRPAKKPLTLEKLQKKLSRQQVLHNQEQRKMQVTLEKERMLQQVKGWGKALAEKTRHCSKAEQKLRERQHTKMTAQQQRRLKAVKEQERQERIQWLAQKTKECLALYPFVDVDSPETASREKAAAKQRKVHSATDSPQDRYSRVVYAPAATQFAASTTSSELRASSLTKQPGFQTKDYCLDPYQVLRSSLEKVNVAPDDLLLAMHGSKLWPKSIAITKTPESSNTVDSDERQPVAMGPGTPRTPAAAENKRRSSDMKRSKGIHRTRPVSPSIKRRRRHTQTGADRQQNDDDSDTPVKLSPQDTDVPSESHVQINASDGAEHRTHGRRPLATFPRMHRSHAESQNERKEHAVLDRAKQRQHHAEWERSRQQRRTRNTCPAKMYKDCMAGEEVAIVPDAEASQQPPPFEELNTVTPAHNGHHDQDDDEEDTLDLVRCDVLQTDYFKAFEKEQKREQAAARRAAEEALAGQRIIGRVAQAADSLESERGRTRRREQEMSAKKHREHSRHGAGNMLPPIAMPSCTAATPVAQPHGNEMHAARRHPKKQCSVPRPAAPVGGRPHYDQKRLLPTEGLTKESPIARPHTEGLTKESPIARPHRLITLQPTPVARHDGWQNIRRPIGMSNSETNLSLRTCLSEVEDDGENVAVAPLNREPEAMAHMPKPDHLHMAPSHGRPACLPPSKLLPVSNWKLQSVTSRGGDNQQDEPPEHTWPDDDEEPHHKARKLPRLGIEQTGLCVSERAADKFSVQQVAKMKRKNQHPAEEYSNGKQQGQIYPKTISNERNLDNLQQNSQFRPVQKGPNVNAAMVLANRATGRSKAIAVPDHTGGNPDAVANQKHETWTPVKTRTSGLSALLNNQESDSDEPVAQPVVPRRLMSKARVPLGSYVPAFSGAACYINPRVKSNRPLIHNAIRDICLAGLPNTDRRNSVLKALARSQAQQVLILFREVPGCQFRALYEVEPSSEVRLVKLLGAGPDKITGTTSFDGLYKYNSGSKSFIPIHGQTLSASVDAFTIHGHRWRKRPK